MDWSGVRCERDSWERNRHRDCGEKRTTFEIMWKEDEQLQCKRNKKDGERRTLSRWFCCKSNTVVNSVIKRFVNQSLPSNIILVKGGSTNVRIIQLSVARKILSAFFLPLPLHTHSLTHYVRLCLFYVYFFLQENFYVFVVELLSFSPAHQLYLLTDESEPSSLPPPDYIFLVNSFSLFFNSRHLRSKRKMRVRCFAFQ